jgi:transposase
MEKNRVEMSQRDRDVLKVMSGVLKGERTQSEAARLLKRSERQIRRLSRRMEVQGDVAVIHGLRGRPSNRRVAEAVRRQVLELYQSRYADFGPTLACEKLLEEHELSVARETLRQLLLKEGLWQCKRKREKHRQRRQRRACFGEMVQADASTHDWLEGRGPMLTLVGMIDDATGRLLCRFHEAETTVAYMDVLGRWMRKHGRPVSWYSDRHGIFRAEEKVSGYDEKRSVPTQFSRALCELGMELILANSPQAKGRVERAWGTAQDRLVKELRPAGARTIDEANAVLEGKFLPWFNRVCTHKSSSGNDAHRGMDKLDVEAILSIQEERVVANDYTICFETRRYQLLAPAWPGERGGKVIVEKRADGAMKIRFKGRYLEYDVLPYAKESAEKVPGALPPDPRSLAPEPIPAAGQNAKDRADASTRSAAVHRPAGCSGRTPALPCPSGGRRCGTSRSSWCPAPAHPWRTAAVG